MKIDKKFWLALTTLVGTIVGVGLFGLPYLTVKTSLTTMLIYFLLIGTFAVIMQLVYGEIILKTKGKHQFSGYTDIYLGHHWKIIAFLAEFLAISGALTAYLIVGGDFFWQLLGPVLGGSVHLYIAIYFILGAALVYLGIKSVSQSEFILFLVLLAAIVLFFVGNLENLNLANLAITGSGSIFLPYGAVIFSLWGVTVIPEIAEILGGEHRNLKRTVIWGIIISVLIYIIFILTVVGLSGSNTVKEAIPGLKNFLSPTIIKVALILGLMTTFTSFLGLAEAAKRAFIEDWKLNRSTAWLMSCFLPPLLYLLGLHNFLNIISIVGAIMLGIFGIILFRIYLKVKNGGQKHSDYSLHLPNWLSYSFIVILVIGIALEIFFSL